MTQLALALLPDLPGLVHGIVSLDPPTIQCDGCGYVYTRPHLAHAVILSGIGFNARAAQRGDRRRLCVHCAQDAGWGT